MQENRNVRWGALAWQLALPVAVGIAAALLSSGGMKQSSQLPQPSFSPPNWVFPAVWTILYLLMGFASYRTQRSDAPTAEKRSIHRLYAVQLALTFLWPMLFFAWQQYVPALVCLAVLWCTVLWWCVRLAHVDRLAAWLQAPYMAWLCFALCLNVVTMTMR